MWKAILGTIWGLRVIPILFIAIVSGFWYFGGMYHTDLTLLVWVASTVATPFEAWILINKINKK